MNHQSFHKPLILSVIPNPFKEAPNCGYKPYAYYVPDSGQDTFIQLSLNPIMLALFYPLYI